MPLKYTTNERLMLFGQTGSGKSYFIKQFIKGINKYIIWDIKFEYSEFGSCVHSLTELKSAVQTKGRTRIIYQPKPQSINYMPEFEAVCFFILNFLRNFTFIVEELQLVAPQGAISPVFKRLITTGRSLGVGCIGITQRSQLVDKTTLTQAEHIIIFYVTTKDIEYLSGFFGEGIKWLLTAPKYSYVTWSKGVIENNPPV